MDKEQRKIDRASGRYDRHRDGYDEIDVSDRRRTDRDSDDVGRGLYSREIDNGFSGRLDRDEGFRGDWYERDDGRMNKARDRDDQQRYDGRRKDGSFRNKVCVLITFVVLLCKCAFSVHVMLCSV